MLVPTARLLDQLWRLTLIKRPLDSDKGGGSVTVKLSPISHPLLLRMSRKKRGRHRHLRLCCRRLRTTVDHAFTIVDAGAPDGLSANQNVSFPSEAPKRRSPHVTGDRAFEVVRDSLSTNWCAEAAAYSVLPRKWNVTGARPLFRTVSQYSTEPSAFVCMPGVSQSNSAPGVTGCTPIPSNPG
jgi:hypothetical protein